MAPDRVPAAWSELLAVGCVADDVSAFGIARYAGVDLATADAALAEAVEAGVLTADGGVDEKFAARAVADLPVERAAEVHAVVARHLLAAGPERVVDAVRHARAAGSVLDLEELVAMADQGGRMSLALGDYASANELLTLAVELDVSENFGARGARLCDLADAVDGLGGDARCKDLLSEAARLGAVAHDSALVARAAIRYSDPLDWNDGDTRAAGLLHQAEQLDLDEETRTAILAARARIEMRIPVANEDSQQLAWLTRPNVAQPLADEALAKSESMEPHTRLLALASWRTTHRAPEFLDHRREVTAEALDLAQRLRRPADQVGMAVYQAVDAIESGDRPLFDEALAVARWVSERDGNPRLRWRAHSLAAGGALIDGDAEAAEELVRRATEIAQPHDVQGWFACEMLFAGQAVINRDDPEEIVRVLPIENVPAMASPLGLAAFAYAAARIGNFPAAEARVREALALAEEESSYLLLVSRLAAAVVLLDVPDLHTDVVDRLTPWADSVAVDTNVWWCDGPVSLRLAELHHARGRDDLAQTYLSKAEPVAAAVKDVRAMRRSAELRAALSDVDSAPSDEFELTSREVDVLRLMASGLTNPQIADRLAYSLSTIRADSVQIYRKLGVRGRSEAVSVAHQRRLIPFD
jgi:DNA-binding CsgD family transcriptional regulator